MSGNPDPHPLTFLGSDTRVARRLARPIGRFLHVEAAGGILLLVATVIALIWVNSPAGDSYHELWETEVKLEVGDFFSLEGHGHEEEGHEEEGHGDEGGSQSDNTDETGLHGGEGEHALAVPETANGASGENEASASGEQALAESEGADGASGESKESHGLSLEAIVNDALMAIFFFVVGMEIKLELVNGQLRDKRQAALPAMAAIGGMVVPALLYFLLNTSSPESAGWGIPMATDIAFALGVVSLLGNRVPSSLKVFLLTLAIVDDIGAIVVIAVFYTTELSFTWLLVALGLLALVWLLREARVWFIPLYVVVGCFVWLAVFESGIHATIAGVCLGLLTPARPLQSKPGDESWLHQVFADDETEAGAARRAEFEIRETVPVAERLVNALHPFTSYMIIPIFALANAGIELSREGLADAASSSVTIGIVLGLVVGKIVGVSFFTWLAVRLGISSLPPGVRPGQILGIAAVAGIGFTVSIFITGLAFTDELIQNDAKIGILVASFLAAIIGAAFLWKFGDPDGADPEGDPSSAADEELASSNA